MSRHSPPGASWWSVYPPPPSQCLVGSLTERKNKVKVSQRVKIKVSIKVITLQGQNAKSYKAIIFFSKHAFSFRRSPDFV